MNDKQQDNWLWLEEIDSEQSLSWVEQQNQQTLAVLEQDSRYQSLYQNSLTILENKDQIPWITRRGKYLYNFWQDEQHVRGIWRRTTLEEYRKKHPDWELLLDIDALGQAEGESWVWAGAVALYPDCERCLISLSRGGTDAVEVREFDLVNKSFVDDGFSLPEAKQSHAWFDKDHILVATDFGEGSLTESGYPAVAKIWRRGTPLDEAVELVKGKQQDVLISPDEYRSADGDIHLITLLPTFFTRRYWAFHNEQVIELPLPETAEVIDYLKQKLIIKLRDHWKSEQGEFAEGSLISVDYPALLQGKLDIQSIYVPEANSAVDEENITTTRDFLLIVTLTDVQSRLRVFDYKEGEWVEEPIPDLPPGSLSLISSDIDNNDFYFSAENFLTPRALNFYSFDDRQSDVLKELPDQFLVDGLEWEQRWATSEDGTRIPYFIVGKSLNDRQIKPTLLYGYGGFEISLTPQYHSVVGKNWLEKGGVFVLANIRGGGEFGPAWHQSAKGVKRHKAFEDFIAVAEALISDGICTSETLGIEGGSNGGLLVGAVFTQRPELFNAVVCQVPLLDMQRYHLLLAGASWVDEYGNPDDADEWQWLSAYSPYQNLKDEQHYPKVLFTTSTKDDRVHPGHARKMVARMQELGYPVYYFENTEGGHAAAADNRQRARMQALEFTYLWQQLSVITT